MSEELNFQRSGRHWYGLKHQDQHFEEFLNFLDFQVSHICFDQLGSEEELCLQ